MKHHKRKIANNIRRQLGGRAYQVWLKESMPVERSQSIIIDAYVTYYLNIK